MDPPLFMQFAGEVRSLATARPPVLRLSNQRDQPGMRQCELQLSLKRSSLTEKDELKRVLQSGLRVHLKCFFSDFTSLNGLAGG
jgi:hypothetical protein